MKFKKSRIFSIFKCVVLNTGHTRINLALRKHIAAKLDSVSTCYLVPCYVTAFHRTAVNPVVSFTSLSLAAFYDLQIFR